MGQKIHPTGFRIGVNKTHNSTWFADYSVYSKVLQEDFKIRNFFEKEWESFYSKAGIANLEIKRKVNQLELLIYAARPKVIALESDSELSINNLKCKLQSKLNLNPLDTGISENPLPDAFFISLNTSLHFS